MVDVRRLPVGEDNDEIAVALDDLAREGARRMIATALEAEVADYVERFADDRGEDGKRLVVRNGRARERKVTIGSGTVSVQAPRVNDKRIDEETGERKRFSSKILPAYARRSPKVNDVLPVLYLRGFCTGDFGPAFGAAARRGRGRPMDRRPAAAARRAPHGRRLPAPAGLPDRCRSRAGTARCGRRHGARSRRHAGADARRCGALSGRARATCCRWTPS